MSVNYCSFFTSNTSSDSDLSDLESSSSADPEDPIVREEELLLDEGEDYYRQHRIKCVAQVIVGVGIALSEWMLFSYAFKSHDISSPGSVAILISAAVCIPSVCCSLISNRE